MLCMHTRHTTCTAYDTPERRWPWLVWGATGTSDILEHAAIVDLDGTLLAWMRRYGTKVLELAKGKVAVEVGTEKDLVPTLELIKTAVLNGELDTQIDAAANKLRDGFAQ